jgi:hypothetical protein
VENDEICERFISIRGRCFVFLKEQKCSFPVDFSFPFSCSMILLPVMGVPFSENGMWPELLFSIAGIRTVRADGRGDQDCRGNCIMFELHFSDLPVPAIIFVCGAWITISHSLHEAFQFMVGAFFI